MFLKSINTVSRKEKEGTWSLLRGSQLPPLPYIFVTVEKGVFSFKSKILSKICRLMSLLPLVFIECAEFVCGLCVDYSVVLCCQTSTTE